LTGGQYPATLAAHWDIVARSPRRVRAHAGALPTIRPISFGVIASHRINAYDSVIIVTCKKEAPRTWHVP
jgi:hypothetical protein